MYKPNIVSRAVADHRKSCVGGWEYGRGLGVVWLQVLVFMAAGSVSYGCGLGVVWRWARCCMHMAVGSVFKAVGMDSVLLRR